MTRKWAGLGRERHGNLKVVVMSVALLAFIVAWVGFVSSHNAAATEALVLSGGATSDPAPVATPTLSIDGAGSSGAAPLPTATPDGQADPPDPVPVRRRTTRGS